MTELRFSGDIGLLQGSVLALVVGAAAWLLYFRQLHQRPGISRFVLPSLRGLAIFFLVIMLTQPILHHRNVIGELGRLFVVIDSSKSMNVMDPDTDPARKVLAAHAQGRIDPKHVDDDVRLAIDTLEYERLRLEHAVSRATARPELRQQLAGLVAAAKAAMKHKDLLPAQVGFVEPEAGVVRHEIWNKVPGGALEEMNKAKAWFRKPDVVDELKALATRENRGDNYGSRIVGYLHPPADGEYTFWISGDDESRFYLSSGPDPETKKELAKVSTFTGVGEWNKAPEQKSPGVLLQKGRRYYFELLHKEGVGGDHVAVGWQLPDGTRELPIPGARLSSLPINYNATPAAFLSTLQKHIAAAQAAVDDGVKSEVLISRLRNLLASVTVLETALRLRFYEDLRQAAGTDPKVADAVIEFDRTSRWRRIQALLFEGTDPLLADLAEKHEVELMALNGDRVESLWRSRAGRIEQSAEIPAFLASTPNRDLTDLATALEVEPSDRKTAVVLLTDGRNNHGKSPVQQAKILGNRGIEVYTVGYGSELPPQDLAIQDVELPQTVYYKDRVQGKLTFLDTMRPGEPFNISVKFSIKGNSLWEKELQTNGGGVRTVDFDFPIEQHVKKVLGQTDARLKYNSIPTAMQVSISYVEGDRFRQNNRDTMHFLVATRKRRILLIDHRPRWEWRYLDAMFTRDDKWEVNAVLPQVVKNVISFKRGKRAGMLPTEKEELFKYDLVILGDVPVRLFREHELIWLKEFVEQRGGGLVLIDGRRRYLRPLAQSDVKDMVPVQWNGADDVRNIQRLGLTPAGRKLTALDLSDGKEKNERVWAALPPPHWMARVEPLAGAETFAVADKGATQKPLLVFRRFGSGKVLYVASPDLWRWRYKKADRHHRRFWNQVAEWIMEQPFAVQDQHVAIDAGPSVYAIGERADLRVRLRDRHGKAMIKARAEAVLQRDGKPVATIPLDAAGAGLYLARTAALEPGEYAVKVKVKGLDSDKLRATARFNVEAPVSYEMSELACNRELLQEVALNTGGAFLREEQLRELDKHLASLSTGRIEEKDTALWQSYWYFVAVIALFTIEWVWRKRKGLL